LDIKLISNINKEKIENKPKNHFKKREGKPLISPQTLISHGRLQPFSSEKGFRKIRV
jgi:hypothetical protein